MTWIFPASLPLSLSLLSLPPQVQEYDSISRLDPWLTAVLLHLKKSIEAEPEVN